MNAKILFQSRSKIDRLIIAVFYLMAWSTITFAADLDGSKTLYGVTGKIIKINRARIIDDVDPDTVGLPRKFLIDFKTRRLLPSKDSVVRKSISFKRAEHVENMIVMQGVDEGVEGVEDGLAYVVFGKCTPLDSN